VYIVYVYVYAHNSVSHISVSSCVYVLHVCICDSVFQALKSVGVAKPSNVTDYLLEYSFLGANY